MNDLGSDAGSTSLSLLTKVLEAILQLINKIYEAHMKAPEQKIAQLKLKAAKTEDEKLTAIKKLNGKTGYINNKLLDKTGELCKVTEISLTKEEIRQFNAIAKRQGLLYTAVSNEQLKADGEKAFLFIKCRMSDMELLKSVANCFNDEKRIEKIDGRIAEILAKGEEKLSAQDYVDLRTLAQQKEDIQRAYTEMLNTKMQETVLQNAYDESKLKPMDIGEALNQLTGREIDKDQYSIIADAHNPSKFIKCHGYEDKDPETGKPYIKTEYEVYHGDECVLKTHDGRFDGRPSGYWTQEKEKIEKAADFSGEYYKFFTPEEYKEWAAHVIEQNRGELSEMEKTPETKDYNKCRQDAYSKLEENGVQIKEGVAYDKQSDKPLSEYIKDPNLIQEQKAQAAESMVIGRQLSNYDNIEGLRNHLDYVNSQLILAKPGSDEYTAAEKDKESTKEQLEAAYQKEIDLVEERKSVNAVQSVQQTEQERKADRPQEEQTLNKEAEHPDERRGERVDEHDPQQMTMEEAKGEIEQEKAKDGAKGTDAKDRQAADPTKAKTPKTKTDRAD